MATETTPTRAKQLQHRYEGIAKVTGKAKYAAEFSQPFPKADLLYAYMVQATIPNGTIASIDRHAADRSPGIVAILTPFNAPKLNQAPPEPPARRNLSLLQDNEVHYSGQPVTVVVAKSLNEAKAAALLLKIKYVSKPAQVSFKEKTGDARWPKNPGKEPPGNHRGDVQAGFQKSSVTIEQTYITPIQHHNPMEPHATIAWWEGERLNVYDSTQYISGVKVALAKTLDIPVDYVRVMCPLVGGGFGSKGSMWSHVPLCAMAAKVTGKPVKLVLDRAQMFGPVGGRPSTINRIKLGASADGKLLAMHRMWL
jgi:xanthine dehydrogenase YagR molybdenum-binding subunit